MKRPIIGFRRINAEGHKTRLVAEWDGQPARPPKAGEYFISGAKPMAYKAYNDMTSPYFIAVIKEPK